MSMSPSRETPKQSQKDWNYWFSHRKMFSFSFLGYLPRNCTHFRSSVCDENILFRCLSIVEAYFRIKHYTPLAASFPHRSTRNAFCLSRCKLSNNIIWLFDCYRSREVFSAMLEGILLSSYLRMAWNGTHKKINVSVAIAVHYRKKENFVRCRLTIAIVLKLQSSM